MVSQVLITVLLVTAAGSAYVLLEDDDPTQTVIWPSTYYFKAETIDVKNGYTEPFEIWYSAEYNRSRIDYYDGVFKEYHIASTDDEEGHVYKRFYLADEDLETEWFCYHKAKYEYEQKQFLPEFDEYIHIEETELNGIAAHKWRKDYEDEEMTTEEYLYTYRSDNGVDLPLRYIYINKNLVKGVIEDHTIVNYYNFKPNFNAKKELFGMEDEACVEDPDDDFQTQVSRLNPYHPDHIDEAFHSYKKHHNKNYHPKETELRKRILHQKWKRVVAHNRKNSTYKMELNKFSDMTSEELQLFRGAYSTDSLVEGTAPFPHSAEELIELSQDLPESYDLRLEGFIGPVKFQRTCGSCWAFAATAAVEGAHSKFYGSKNLDLSEQSLVDCSWAYRNAGCGGGWVNTAFQYIKDYGIPKESEYHGYMAKNGLCQKDSVLPENTQSIKIKDFVKVTPHSSTALKVALVKYGPVAVLIHATDDMPSYANGIYYDLECKRGYHNHAVLVVGYGTRDGTPYWIVKNSWDEDFGQDGYILMSAVGNNCNVLDVQFYPLV